MSLFTNTSIDHALYVWLTTFFSGLMALFAQAAGALPDGTAVLYLAIVALVSALTTYGISVGWLSSATSGTSSASTTGATPPPGAAP